MPISNPSGVVTDTALAATITGASSAGALTGTEVIPIDQSGLKKLAVDTLLARAATILSGVTVAAGGSLGFTGRSKIKSSADGYLMLTNNAETGFTMLRFGNATTAPAFKVSGGANIELRSADDAGYAIFACGTIYTNGQQITSGAADSGGTGFKVLRIPN